MKMQKKQIEMHLGVILRNLGNQMKERFFTIIIFCIVTIIGLSANVKFSAIPPGRVIEGDKFQITFRLENGQGENFKGPQLSGCKLLTDRGVCSFSSYAAINGKVTSVSGIEYTCTYRAEKEGKVTVPAVSIVVNGKQYKTSPILFEIVKNTGQPNQRVQTSILDEYAVESPAPIAEDEVFVRIIMSKEQVYEQEPIECEIKLYTQYGIESFLPTVQPSFDGFIIEDISSQPSMNKRETYNGKDYYTATLKHCVIFPQKSGSLTINSGKYDVVAQKYEKVVIGGGFAYGRIPIKEKLVITSNSATIDILPLPTPRPDNFSGAVGQFSVETKLSSNTFRTNETANYELIITGTGNIKYIKEPIIDFPIEFEQYSPKSTYDTRIDSGMMSGKAIFEYPFVPQSVGKFQIPQSQFVYFDPIQNKYETLELEGYLLNVAKGADNPSNMLEKESDIRDIKMNAEHNSVKAYVIYLAWYWVVIVSFIVGFIVYAMYNKKKMKLYSDVTGFKLAKANKVAQKRMKLAREYMNNHRSEDFFKEINNALTGYLSDKLSISTSQLSKENINTQLTICGINEEVCLNVIDIMDQCELALYSPQNESEIINDIYQKTIDVINDIESVKIKKK